MTTKAQLEEQIYELNEDIVDLEKENRTEIDELEDEIRELRKELEILEDEKAILGTNVEDLHNFLDKIMGKDHLESFSNLGEARHEAQCLRSILEGEDK